MSRLRSFSAGHTNGVWGRSRAGAVDVHWRSPRRSGGPSRRALRGPGGQTSRQRVFRRWNFPWRRLCHECRQTFQLGTARETASARAAQAAARLGLPSVVGGRNPRRPAARHCLPGRSGGPGRSGARFPHFKTARQTGGFTLGSVRDRHLASLSGFAGSRRQRPKADARRADKGHPPRGTSRHIALKRLIYPNGPGERTNCHVDEENHCGYADVRRATEAWYRRRPSNSSKWSQAVLSPASTSAIVSNMALARTSLSGSQKTCRCPFSLPGGRAPALFDNMLRVLRATASDPAKLPSFDAVIRHEEVFDLGDALAVELSEIGELRRVVLCFHDCDDAVIANRLSRTFRLFP